MGRCTQRMLRHGVSSSIIERIYSRHESTILAQLGVGDGFSNLVASVESSFSCYTDSRIKYNTTRTVYEYERTYVGKRFTNTSRAD